MNAEHKDTRQPHGRDAVVTYTRVSPHHQRPKRSARRAPREDVAPELTLDGAEVPSVDPGEPVAFDFSIDDRHRGPDDLIEDFVEDSRRPDWLRYGLVAASLAVIAGVGILAATVGVATILPGGSAQSDRSGVPALAYNSPDPDAEPVSTTGSVRKIPMPSGAPEAAWRTEVPPPIPRPRPDHMPTPAEPEATAQSSAPAPQSDGPSEPPPASSTVAVAPPAAAPAPVASAPGDSGADSLITSIEETLARIDAREPAPPPGATLQAPQPATEPPVVMTQPSYPPIDSGPPPGSSAINPAGDIEPPPATVDGYGGYYSTGPVPPEPVPGLYPQAPQLNSATPDFYQSAPYGFPPLEATEETEVRRPGFLRRTLAKATGAVGRVLARD